LLEPSLIMHEDQDQYEDDYEHDGDGDAFDLLLTDLESYLEAIESDTVELSSIELSNQGIGSDGAIELIEKLKEHNKLSGLTALKLDGNDIDEEGATLLSEILNTTNARMLDLKWNLIGLLGVQSLGTALSTNTTLTSVNLEGNEITEEGAVAMAESLSSNTTLRIFEIKDNSIGDEGVSALSKGLGKTGLIHLDVTSNNITSAGAEQLAQHFLSVADGPSTLETIIINNNPIGDQGATSIAKALVGNNSLKSLQLRNCSIDEDGILALIGTLTNEQHTVTEVDLNLNPCGVRGQIALNDMLLTKPEIYIEWKDASGETNWTLRDIQVIIDHYGQSEILSNFLQGLTLAPLIENHKVLGAMDITDQSVANKFIQSMKDQPEFFINGINMIITMLNQGEDVDILEDEFLTPNSETVATFDELQPLFNAIHTLLPDILTRLATTPEAVPTTSGLRPPAGAERLVLMRFVATLAHLNISSINERLVELKATTIALKLAQDFPINNFLHHEIRKYFSVLVHSRVLRLDFFSNTETIDFLIELCKGEWALPQSERRGYSALVAHIANLVVKHRFDDGGESVLTAHPNWSLFAEQALGEYNILNSPYDRTQPDFLDPTELPNSMLM